MRFVRSSKLGCALEDGAGPLHEQHRDAEVSQAKGETRPDHAAPHDGNVDLHGVSHRHSPRDPDGHSPSRHQSFNLFDTLRRIRCKNFHAGLGDHDIVLDTHPDVVEALRHPACAGGM